MRGFVLLLACTGLGSCSREITAPSGAVIWRVPGRAGAGQAALDDSTVYFVATADSHAVHAFDLASGTLRWTAPTGAVNNGSFTTTGCRTASQLVVCGDISDLVAFDRADGHLAWRYRPTVGPYPGEFAITLDSAKTSLFAPTQTGAVHAIDAATGQARWVVVLPSVNSLQFDKVLDGGDLVFSPFTVFASKDTGGVVAIDKADGSIRWLVRFPLAADSSNGAKDAVLWGNFVIVSRQDGRITAVDRATGQTAWTLPGVGTLPAWGSGSAGSDLRTLIVSGETLYAASLTGWVIAYDLPSHTELWRATVKESSFLLGDADHDGTMAYLTGTSGLVFALSLTHPQDLSPLATPSSGMSFISPPAIAPDRILVGANDGYYAIRR